jgi:replicative DNA helicase
VGRGELWIVLGLTGAGKSQFLVNMGAQAVDQGKPVIHITVGDLDEVDVGIRYAARLTRLSMDDVISSTETYQERAKKLDAYLERYLRIKYYPSYSVTTPNIRSYVSRLIAKDNIRPGMIIIDYPDEFKPTKENDYQNMGDAYSQIGALAHDFNCACWVASQVRRWKAEKDTDVITMNDIADSWRKAAKADGIVTFNRTSRERQWNMARLYVDKVRRGRSDFTIDLVADFERCYIAQADEEDIKRFKQGKSVDDPLAEYE